MSCFITDDYDMEGHGYPLSLEEISKIADEITEAAAAYVDCPYLFAVELTLTDDDTIRRVNLEQRKIDRATDVLSFPMLEYEKPGDFGFLASAGEDVFDPACFDPDSGELLLGDILISLDHALLQAREYGHSLKREIAFLIAHSMLHLFGYDHMEEEDRIRMEAMQEEILQGKGYTRD